MTTFTLPIIGLFILLGLLAGFMAGLLGIGGGIILVPLFLWAFNAAGFPSDIIVHTAFGTSLGIIILTSISSVLGHRKRGNVNRSAVVYLAIGGVLGALFGAWLASLLTGDWLKGLFGVMQILVAIKLLIFHPRLPPEELTIARGPLVLVGLAGGIFSAFFGVGGGVIAVPLMLIVLRFPIHLAVGNSSALIVISSIFGCLSYMLHGWNYPELPEFSYGYVNLLVIMLISPFTMLMARLGVRVASNTAHDKLIKVFAVLLVFVGLRMIYRAWLV